MFFKFTRDRNSKRGFTLIELMVVVAIVAILAAVAIPAYLSYKENSMRVVARASFLAVVDSYNAYIAINEDPYPIKDDGDPTIRDVIEYIEAHSDNIVTTDHLNLDMPFYNPGPAVKMNNFYAISDSWDSTSGNDWMNYYSNDEVATSITTAVP